MTDWLHIVRGNAPLVVAMPHAGARIPEDIETRLLSPWRARMDADWWIDQLYDFATELNATIVRTTISRTVIDVDRDPSGASLYPGQATTDLCPVTTFDGEPLYPDAGAPSASDIAARRETWFTPYHQALQMELMRLRTRYDRVVLYDAHSIRSRVSRLFDGELPAYNIGTNSGSSCDPALCDAIARVVRNSKQSYVIDGRFKGGWTTRHYGQPNAGVHAVQMELAQRLYMEEPAAPTPDNWPTPLDSARATPARNVLKRVLKACLDYAENKE